MRTFKTMYTLKKYLLLLLAAVLTHCKTERVDAPELAKQIPPVSNTSDCPNYMLKNKKNNWNISFLLDLSDRINTNKYPNSTMEYFQRDLGYIQSVASSFVQHVQQKRLVLMNDHMQLYFEPEPADASINEKARLLQVSLDKNLNSKQIKEIQTTYTKIPKEIYTTAKHKKKYLGSDIWRFFKDRAKRYCIKKCNRNILIILTDGYMFHEDSKLREQNLSSYLTPKSLINWNLHRSNWKKRMTEKHFGFIPATADLGDLEVLVIGLVNHDKKQNPYGLEVMKAYWKNWLTNMGVTKYEIYGAELPTNMDRTIQQFLNN